MKFEIGFNRKDGNDKKSFYDFIGASPISKGDYEYYEIEINTFEELEALMKKINIKLLGVDYGYSAIIDFDPPTLFLDKEC